MEKQLKATQVVLWEDQARKGSIRHENVRNARVGKIK